MASGYGKRQIRSLLNHASGKTPDDTDAGVWFVGLSTVDPADDGQSNNEQAIGVGNYARVATTALTWGVATDATPSVMSSILAVQFPIASADWLAAANMTHFSLWNSATLSAEADYIGRGVLAVAAPILNGQAPLFPIGALRMNGTETP